MPASSRCARCCSKSPTTPPRTKRWARRFVCAPIFPPPSITCAAPSSCRRRRRSRGSSSARSWQRWRRKGRRPCCARRSDDISATPDLVEPRQRAGAARSAWRRSRSLAPGAGDQPRASRSAARTGAAAPCRRRFRRRHDRAAGGDPARAGHRRTALQSRRHLLPCAPAGTGDRGLEPGAADQPALRQGRRAAGPGRAERLRLGHGRPDDAGAEDRCRERGRGQALPALAVLLPVAAAGPGRARRDRAAARPGL